MHKWIHYYKRLFLIDNLKKNVGFIQLFVPPVDANIGRREKSDSLSLSLSNNKGVIFYSEVVFDVFLARGIDIIYIPRPKKILNGTTYMLRPGRYTRECIRDKRYKKKKNPLLNPISLFFPSRFIRFIFYIIPNYTFEHRSIQLEYYTAQHLYLDKNGNEGCAIIQKSLSLSLFLYEILRTKWGN